MKKKLDALQGEIQEKFRNLSDYIDGGRSMAAGMKTSADRGCMILSVSCSFLRMT
jgi:hypothetical protein